MTRPAIRLDFSAIDGVTPEMKTLVSSILNAESTPYGTPRLAVDPRGHRHLLIPVPSSLRMKEDRASAGIQLGPRILEEGEQRLHFLDVVCLKPALFDLFLRIACEMLDALGDAPPDRSCSRVLDRWRALLGAPERDTPSAEVVLALFGELQHLLAITRHDPDGLAAWAGPDRATRDFHANGVALEVKTTTIRDGWRVQIHGVHQLEDVPGEELFLAVTRVERHESGVSVPELVEQVIEAGVDAARLYARLVRAGVAPEQLPALAGERFRVMDRRVWAVTPDFPRIVPTSFAVGRLPVGVAGLDYTLDLTSHGGHLDAAAVEQIHTRLAVRA